MNSMLRITATATLTLLSLISFAAKPIKLPPTLVSVATVKSGSLPNTLQALGSLSAINSVNVSPQIAGQLSKLYVRPGQAVKVGQALAQLDDSIAKANLSAAKSAFHVSKMEYTRMKSLSSQGAVTRQQVDQAYATMESNAADLSVKRTEFNKMKLTAPISGIVGTKEISTGNYVTVGETITTITNIKSLQVDYDVPEDKLRLLKVGQVISIRSDAFPKQHFTGTVSFISPSIDPETRTILVEAKVSNPNDKLRPGMFVTVHQVIGRQQKTLLIPQESLVSTLQGQTVYLVKGSKVQQVPVTLGARGDSMVEITKGLKAGETIVTAGQQKLKTGASIRIKK